jgi:hypothetical protein
MGGFCFTCKPVYQEFTIFVNYSLGDYQGLFLRSVVMELAYNNKMV